MRTDLGCAAVLVALGQNKGSENFDEYENRIIDFLTLSDVNISPLDAQMLKCVIMGIAKRINMNVQKNLRQYYRLKLCELVMDNFERFDNKDLALLLNVVEDSLDRDKTNFITKWRFYPLINAIGVRLAQMMDTYVQTQDFEVKKSIDHIISNVFFFRYINMLHLYRYMPP